MSFDSIFEENISGIHFYPIYSLQKSRVVAWEVSVIIYDYACSVSWSERFEINLLHWKLRALKELVNSQKYFIGVPAKLLAQREVVNTILPMMRAGVVIIVKSAHDLITLSASERNEFFALQRKVKECGSAYWLDDIRPENLQHLSPWMACFKGVNVTISTLNQFNDSPQLFSSFIFCLSLLVDNVIINGVDNKLHFDMAKDAGCLLFQGKYWPEERLHFCNTPVH